MSFTISSQRPSAARCLLAEFDQCQSLPNIERGFSDPTANYADLKEAIEQMLKEHRTDEQPIRLVDGTLTIGFSKITLIKGGPALPALCECLSHYPSIHSLILQCCNFQGNSLDMLMQALDASASLHHIFLIETPFDDVQFGELTTHPWLMEQLQSFYYQNIPQFTINELTGLCFLIQNAPKLQDLALENCQLNNSMVGPLTHSLLSATQLTRLSLSGNTIDDEGAYQLALSLDKITSLRQLDLSSNRLSSAALQGLARALEKHPVPLSLILEDNSDAITPVGVKDLLHRVPALESLNLSYHPQLSAAHVIKKVLKRAHTTLTRLDLRATHFPESDVDAILACKRRRKVEEPSLHVHLQVDKFSANKCTALHSSDLGMLFHLYVTRTTTPVKLNQELLDAINSSPHPTEELLSKAQALPANTESEIAEKTQCFHALLSKEFTVEDIPKDGNCLFHCFAKALQSLEPKSLALDAETLRIHIVDYIIDHQSEFLDFFAPEGSKESPVELLKKHCGKMYENNTWADQTEIKSFYELMKSKGIQRSVVLYQMHNLALKEQAFTTNLIWGDPKTEEPIYLFFENMTHYTLLHRKTQ